MTFPVMRKLANERVQNMRGIRKAFCLTAALWLLSVPLEVFAEGWDAVTLSPEGSGVAVELEMSNAQEEKISAVSVSLQIDEESRDKVKPEFEFAAELGGAVQGYLYDKNTGILNIYAASASSLFEGETLSLGYVQAVPEEPGELLEVEFSYIGSSFQTANEAYGNKAPVVMYEPEPVSIKIGEGAGEGPEAPGDGTEDGSGDGNGDQTGTPGGGNGGGNQNGSSDNENGGGSQNGSSGNGNSSGSGDNRNDGLYDENTQFKNDPSSAEQIESSVVRGDEQHSDLVDMSKGTAAGIGGASLQNPGGKWAVSGGKVSVVSPEKGPASIHIAKGKGTSSKTSDTAGLKGLTGWEEVPSGDDALEKEGGFDGEDSVLGETVAAGSDEAGEGEGEEIRLDQKRGGAIEEAHGQKWGKVLIGIGILVLSGGLGLGGFFVVKSKGSLAGAGKKKRRRRPKGRKPVSQKPASSKTTAKRVGGRKPGSQKPGARKRE